MEALRKEGGELVTDDSHGVALLAVLTRALREPAHRPADRLARAVGALGEQPWLTRVELRNVPDPPNALPTVWATGHGAGAADGDRTCLTAEIISQGERVGSIEVVYGMWLEDTAREQAVWEIAAGLLADTLRAHREISGNASLKQRLDRYERAILTEAMERAHGVQSKAARALRTTPRILSYRLRRQGLHEQLTAARRSVP